MHVLIVDDEPQLRRTLALNLTGRGHHVTAAADGASAVAQARASDADVVLLDLGRPDGDGLDVIVRTREHRPALPIVVLSARTGSQDKVAALDLGAVDYVTKPFDVAELLARLRAASRRADLLLRRPGRLVTGADLLRAMRGDPHHTERSYLRSYMQQLRRKLEVEASRPRFLLTEPGMGYRFVP